MILGILRQIPFFSQLNEEEHTEIIENVRMHFYPAEYVVFKEQDAADKMYIIKSGAVKVYKTDAEGNENDMAVLKHGQFFGEMALISSKPRCAAVKVLEDCELFSITEKDVHDLMQTHPQIATKISETIVARTRENKV